MRDQQDARREWENAGLELLDWSLEEQWDWTEHLDWSLEEQWEWDEQNWKKKPAEEEERKKKEAEGQDMKKQDAEEDDELATRIVDTGATSNEYADTDGVAITIDVAAAISIHLADAGVFTIDMDRQLPHGEPQWQPPPHGEPPPHGQPPPLRHRGAHGQPQWQPPPPQWQSPTHGQPQWQPPPHDGQPHDRRYRRSSTTMSPQQVVTTMSP